MFDYVCIFQVFHLKLTDSLYCMSDICMISYETIISFTTFSKIKFGFIMMSHLQLFGIAAENLPHWQALQVLFLCTCFVIYSCFPKNVATLIFNNTLGYIVSPVLEKQAYLLYLPENQHLLFKDYIFQALHPILLLSSDMFLSKPLSTPDIFFSKSVCLHQIFSFHRQCLHQTFFFAKSAFTSWFHLIRYFLFKVSAYSVLSGIEYLGLTSIISAREVAF